VVDKNFLITYIAIFDPLGADVSFPSMWWTLLSTLYQDDERSLADTQRSSV